MDTKDFFGGRRLLLASASPRRRELLRFLGAEVENAPLIEVDETYPADLPAEQVPEYLSRLKAEPYRATLRPDEVLVTADTVVINHGKVVGKPHSEEEAVEMLRSLSGHAHRVVTGVTLTTTEGSHSFSEHTDVEFAPLTDDEIRTYVERFRPLDKAGAYGIQEWIGYIGVKGITGDYYNVMGLPLHALYTNLKAMLK